MKLLELDIELPFADHAFGTKEGTADDVEETVRIYSEIVGPIAHMRQVHGDRIVYADGPGVYEEADALFTDHHDLWLAVKSADCVPVLLSCPQAVAVVHCGWRGLEAELLPKTIQLLMDEYQITTIDIHMHIGPHISWNNYMVEEKFKDLFDEKHFKPAGKKGYTLMNLAGIARSQAREMGMPEANIVDAGLCTFHEKDLFHSHRRNKASGKDGYNVQLSMVKRSDMM